VNSIIGVNTFLSSKDQRLFLLSNSCWEERSNSNSLENLHKANAKQVQVRLENSRCLKNENLFDHLMEATKVCTLGQITAALFEVGGQYRKICVENHFLRSKRWSES
jgi:methylmalonyl-CoA mutase